MRPRAIATLLAVAAVASPPLVRAQGVPTDEESVVRVAEQLRQATVSVLTPAGPLGSGFVAAAEGWVVTNLHVLAGAPTPVVRYLDGQTSVSHVVAEDPASDLAVLAPSSPASISPLTFGDSDQVRVGEGVLAMGSPFGLDGTVTQGIVSARREVPLDDGSANRDLLQTDAPVHPGNSGGPLCDLRGHVIGVTTAILSRGAGAGIGFAIPANAARTLLDHLRASRDAIRAQAGVGARAGGAPEAAAGPRPWLGLRGSNTVSDKGMRGVRVDAIAPGSPASSAALRTNGAPPPAEYAHLAGAANARDADVVVAADGRLVGTTDELQQIVQAHAPGETLELTVSCCGGTFRQVNVVLGAAPERDGSVHAGRSARSR